ncbi:MAG: hypothetical protein QGI76_13805, partial [Dehalococcoidia bacterium]|nr:hypothetical protein [Dehalococcoidia bacterium]
VRCHRDGSRTVEFPVSLSRRSPFGNEHAFGCELLDAVLEWVCNVDAAVGCRRDTPRGVELPIARALATTGQGL